MGLLKEYEDLPVEWKLAPEKHLEEIFRRVDRYIQDAEGYYLGEDLEAVRDAVRNLRNLAQARAALREDLEYLDTRLPLWEVALDFDLDTQPTPEEVAEWERRQQEDRAKVIAQRKTLRLFFIFACRIYRQVGTRPSGGEVSRLKRLELTDGMKKALDEVKRPARTSFDDRGRLPRGTVSAIYSGPDVDRRARPARLLHLALLEAAPGEERPPELRRPSAQRLLHPGAPAPERAAPALPAQRGKAEDRPRGGSHRPDFRRPPGHRRDLCEIVEARPAATPPELPPVSRRGLHPDNKQTQ